MRDPTQRLRDVLEAIERIEERVQGGRTAFDNDAMLQVWVLHHLQIIGEACRSLPEDFRQRHTEIDWSRIVGMRHILVHQYFEIDTDIVWAVVDKELPLLQQQVNQILDRVAD